MDTTRALFHLSQVVYFHIKAEYGGGQEVLGIEQIRPAFALVNGKIPINAKPYSREIDIVLKDDAATVLDSHDFIPVSIKKTRVTEYSTGQPK